MSQSKRSASSAARSVRHVSAPRSPGSGSSSLAAAGPGVDPEGLVVKTASWSGRFLYDTTGTAPAIGTYVVNGDANNHLALPAGTPADALAGGGVVMHRHTSGSTNEPWMLVAERGRVYVSVSGSIADDTSLRTGSSGLVAGIGPYDQTSWLAGVTIGASGTIGGNAGVAGNAAFIALRERFDYVEN